ncbi:MAG TPA: hypothetical protein VHS99_22280 [Chloroflexota bacterium]|nr:hypothetical protein [Chloroflexota bacterium]
MMSTIPQSLTGERLTWRFPARQCHEGIPLGNGTFGALLWAAEDAERLRLTLNRADYWLHTGGWQWHPEATYANLQRWLHEEDESSLRRVFEGRAGPDGARPDRPSRLPMGRVDLQLPGLQLRAGTLDLGSGEASLAPRSPGAVADGAVRAVLLREVPVLAVHVRFPAGAGGGGPRPEAVPPETPEVLAHFEAHGLPAAERFGDERAGGWVQLRPHEPALCVAWQIDLAGQDAGPGRGTGRPGDGPAGHATDGATVYVTAVYGESGADAVAAARGLLSQAASQGFWNARAAVVRWWQDWWATAPRIDVPDSTSRLLYHLGLYKLGGLSVPGGPAASLQGPWVEEYRLPPWSGDYHFNVNVQECYWPAYGANHLETLQPLEEMLTDWLPLLRENARRYVGVEDGLLLPHAVDDRGTCMGGFWTGQTDHGSTAWAGQLLWLRYRHTMDREYLRDTAYPVLRGAMRTYEAMLAPAGPGSQELCLPVGVSPEFGGSQARAYGRNPSFQLACIHFLCRALLEASAVLGLEGEDQARWRDVQRRLPIGSIGDAGLDGRSPELLLWDGLALPESHRHHSHLAALYPFGLLDPWGAERELVANSMRRLTSLGMGGWTGWCVPWAAILHARTGQGDAAALLLEIFRRTFMGRGYYTTHDATIPGLSLRANNPSIMQVEAALGAAAAVLELLAQTSAPAGGVLRVFSGCPGGPSGWREASFDGLRAEGAFLLDARREDGQTAEVRVRSEAGGTLRLAHPFGARGATVHTVRGRQRYPGAPDAPVLELATGAGEELIIRPA